tara:strand:+ start:159 stop:548 length:390 start_codon:yes stop_codon:yes gene_type:complete
MRVLVFVLILFLSQNILAARVYGLGAGTCIDYITFYNNAHQNYFNFKRDGEIAFSDPKDAGEMFQLQSYLDFFEGYVTGYNAKTNLTNGDVFGEVDPRVIAVDLKNYCEQFPSKKFIFAVHNVSLIHKK